MPMTSLLAAGMLSARFHEHLREAKSMTDQYILVLCTCPEDLVAARIATTLVEERLAACVNRLSRMTSTYWREGKVRSETEALLLIKTASSRYEALEGRIRELHPDAVPEILALPFSAGSEQYFEWMGQSLAAPRGGPA